MLSTESRPLSTTVIVLNITYSVLFAGYFTQNNGKDGQSTRLRFRITALNLT
jgi:hypothetical protein